MEYFGYSALSILLTAAIGWPLAHLLLPAKLKSVSLAVAPLFGYCYIIFAGFLLYRLNVGGSDVYSLAVAAPPVCLLICLAALGRISLFRQQLTPVLMFGFGYAILSPLFLLADGRAVAISFGNLDVINYAVIARFLQEFPRDTTIGVMGQSDEMVRQVDMFWAGPSLFSAFLSSSLGSAPYKLQSLSFAVISAQASVFAWLIARYGLSLRPIASAAAGLLTAVSPVGVYVVWTSFGAQSASTALILAALFFCMSAMQEPDNRPALYRHAAILVVILSGLMTTYHLMAPALIGLMGLYVLLVALVRLSVRTLFVGAVFLSVAVAVTLVINPWRTFVTVQSIVQLAGAGAGWFHPWLSPERQLGFQVSEVLFNRPGSDTVRYLAAGLAAVAAFASIWTAVRTRSAAQVAFIFGLALPPIVVGLALAVAGADKGVLGGYPSFKFTGTFSPLTLLALLIPFSASALQTSPGPEPQAARETTGARLRSKTLLGGGLAAVAVLFAVDLANVSRLLQNARTSPNTYIMPADTPNIQQVESMPFEGGINISDGREHEVFWASYFTLRRQQNFERFPYGGRPVRIAPFKTSLQIQAEPGIFGDSYSDIFVVDLGEANASTPKSVRLASHYALVRLDAGPVTMSAGQGFWGREVGHRWTGANGKRSAIDISNPGPPIMVKLSISIAVLKPGDAVSAWLNGAPLPSTATPESEASPAAGRISTPSFSLPTGHTIVELVGQADVWRPGGGDPRTLGFSVSEVRLTPG